MHFFRSLWINDLNSNQFTVRNSANEILDYEKLVYSEDGRTKYIHSLSNLGIAYNTKQSTSFILLSDGKIFFESNGYYDPLLIKWEGEMARQRVADILPFDYILK
jgi:hypothetical protein